MTTRLPLLVTTLGLVMSITAQNASAQIYEAVGSRALGMGGAFVAVASDSSATWWNPAGLAEGAFVDVAIARAITERRDGPPDARDRATWFALATPVVGVSFYRTRLSSAAVSGSIPVVSGGRHDRGAGTPIASVQVSQFGVTVLQTLATGVHVGTTLKYLRGTPRTSLSTSTMDVDDLLDTAQELSGGHARNRLDLDAGILAIVGAFRLGAAARNLTQPDFGSPASRLPRQFRVGAAVDLEKAGGPPLIVSFDADARKYDVPTGPRRVLALGAEHWLLSRRLGIRGGVRSNRTGRKESAATGGVSVAVRSGLYLEGHIVGSGSPAERGWGAAARVSF